jgi:hypothetical protein
LRGFQRCVTSRSSRSDICRTWSRITSRAAPASSSPTTLDSPPGWPPRGHHVPASIALVEDGLEPEA